MNLWRLEISRLVRTRRIHVLFGVYVLFGLLGPVSTRYLKQIIDAVGGTSGMEITLPEPTMAAGMAQFISNASQIGTIVVVVVAAGAVALDAIPEMGVFLRTRVNRTSLLLLPRIVVPSVAAGLAFAAGTLAATYEAVLLLGPVPWSVVTAGIALTFVGLVFVVTLVAAVAQLLSGTLATVMLSLGVLLALPILGLLPRIGEFLPTRLLGSVAEIAGGTTVTDLLPATGVTLAAIAACWAAALAGAARREL